MMARIETDRQINPTQLGIELGRVALRVKAGAYVEAPDVDEATLQAAIDAHVADPDFVDPEAVPPGPDPQQELVDAVSDLTFEVAMLKFQLGGA